MKAAVGIGTPLSHERIGVLAKIAGKKTASTKNLNISNNQIE
jgi:hypothetical protein